VNDILSQVKNINGKTNLIPQIQDKLNNLPDDSAVMDLFRQLDPAVVGKVMGLAAGAKDAIDYLESQREGRRRVHECRR
jgi:hypothetical protein